MFINDNLDLPHPGCNRHHQDDMTGFLGGKYCISKVCLTNGALKMIIGAMPGFPTQTNHFFIC